MSSRLMIYRYKFFHIIITKLLDYQNCLWYNVYCGYAGVAQLVVQLIRNEQVACSSHVTSFICK